MVDIIDIGKVPISADNSAGQAGPGGPEGPEGSDARYEPDYESLENEIEKLCSPTVSGEIDWGHIVSLSEKILSTQSKDLTVACYLCIGLLKTSKLEGFATGVHILKDLLENYWDVLFPAKKRMRGRKNAIIWWKDFINKTLPAIDNEIWEKPKRDNFISDLKFIDEFVGNNIEDAPILQPLVESISLIVAEKKIRPKEETKQEVASDSKQTKQNDLQNSSKLEKKSDPVILDIDSGLEQDEKPDKVLEKGLSFIKNAAELYFKQDKLKSNAYELNRISSWLPVETLPSATQGKTLIPPPDSQVISILQNLYDTKKWSDLLESAETRVGQFLFWLDLSRYVSDALEALGASDASSVVKKYTYEYTLRLKGVEKLSFSDGKPFADEFTCQWLDQYRQENQNNNDNSKSTDLTSANINKSITKAFALIKANKLDEALSDINLKKASSCSVREKFLWLQGISKLLVFSKNYDLAYAYSNDILLILNEYKIDVWEPKLAASALVDIVKVLKVMQDQTLETKIKDLIAKISILEPSMAIDLI